ncbi:MAG: response regulator transcription factor [Sedimentisphaerales bacterium]|nr:response regulator transcription factor [Sedimentisphaerales bacterium]
MPKSTILIVDDEEDILELLDHHLSREGYHVLRARSGEQALELARTHTPDMIVLDLMLPGVDGLDVCRQLRNTPATQSTPIIMLTARGEETDIVTGLELGADDYVIKPFSPKVLLARVRAVLRRQKIQVKNKEITEIHDIIIDSGRHEVQVAGKPVELTYTEFKTLELLSRSPGRVFTRYQIVDAIRGNEYAVTDRTVDVQIVSLRKKLQDAGKLIETVRGVGYKMKD